MKNLSSGFLTMSDTNLAEILDLGRRGSVLYLSNIAKIKALISCTVTGQLICAFLFIYAKGSFSHDMAQLKPISNWYTI